MKRCAGTTGRILPTAAPHVRAGGRLRPPERAGSTGEASAGASAKRVLIGGTAGRGVTRPATSALGREEPYVASSAQLAASPLHRGHRAAIPRREALILQAALNHPWLLHDRLEELAETEFRHADTGSSRRPDRRVRPSFRRRSACRSEKTAPGSAATARRDRAELAAELASRGFADLLDRIEHTITTPSVWGARPQAAPADVLLTWTQLVALHRQWQTLTRELKEAELALGAGQHRGELCAAARRQGPARINRWNGGPDRGFGAPSGRLARSF